MPDMNNEGVRDVIAITFTRARGDWGAREATLCAEGDRRIRIRRWTLQRSTAS